MFLFLIISSFLPFPPFSFELNMYNPRFCNLAFLRFHSPMIRRSFDVVDWNKNTARSYHYTNWSFMCRACARVGAELDLFLTIPSASNLLNFTQETWCWEINGKLWWDFTCRWISQLSQCCSSDRSSKGKEKKGFLRSDQSMEMGFVHIRSPLTPCPDLFGARVYRLIIFGENHMETVIL